VSISEVSLLRAREFRRRQLRSGDTDWHEVAQTLDIAQREGYDSGVSCGFQWGVVIGTVVCLGVYLLYHLVT
jgi:tetrahydromethanopterin S-methyltransferase subunit G